MNAPAANPPSPLAEVIARLSALHPAQIDLTLDRIQRLLEQLGHPERKLPPVIHVAGTNGKGSTVAYLRAMLEAAGLRVHVYTSPYLVRANECYRLGRVGGGALVGDDELPAALRALRGGQCRRADHGVRDQDRGGVLPVRATIRPMSCCWRSGSAAGSMPPM